MELRSYSSSHRNSDRILPNIVIPVLSFQTLEFWPCPFNLIFAYIGILVVFISMEILALSFQIVEFWSCALKHWKSVLIVRNIEILAPFNIGIVNLSFHTLGFWLFSYTLHFWSYFFRDWNSCLTFVNTGILALVL